MPDNALSTLTFNAPHPQESNRLLQYYSSGAVTASSSVPKKEWVSGGYYRILDILIDSGTGNAGNSNDIIDIKVNGTSIYATVGTSYLQKAEPDLRPYLLPGDTGAWHNRGSQKLGFTGLPDNVTRLLTPSGLLALVPGDVISLYVAQVGSVNGSARVKVCIVLGAA